MKSRTGRLLLLAFLLAIPTLFFVLQWSGLTVVRGKSSALPLAVPLSPALRQVETLALADAQVLGFTAGKRAEVMTVERLEGRFLPADAVCSDGDCYQVQIYLFDENGTVTALVDLAQQAVTKVHYLPGMQPGLNDRLKNVAVDLIHESTAVADALGFQPPRPAIGAMDASLAVSDCGEPHLCVAATFITEDERILWVFVDLTTESIAGLRWGEPVPGVLGGEVGPPDTTAGCTNAGNVTQDGWSVDYEVTPSDGFLVHGVTYNGSPVLTSAKLVEWHADYGGFGFRDATGCTGAGGFPIFPYGPPQVVQLANGFEVIQDFRMSNWGQPCNYRYEQHYKFYDDGSFRIVAGAYGKGCYGATPANYLPLLRIDLAPGGDLNNNLAAWDGANWVQQATEFWEQQSTVVNGDLQRWWITGPAGSGYRITPGQGQFGDGGRGDDAYFYATAHNAAQGDTDLGGSIGDCCAGTYQQGPHNYVNGESLVDANLVLWYVPQLFTDLTVDDYYCWTVNVNETYPCFGGPLFTPTFALDFDTFMPLIPGE